MNEEYKRLAYERAVWVHLIDQMEGELIVEDIQPAKQVVCDVLPFNERIVPQVVLKSVVVRMKQAALDITEELSKFEMVRKTDERKPGSGAVEDADGAAAGAVAGGPGKASGAGRAGAKAPKRARKGG